MGNWFWRLLGVDPARELARRQRIAAIREQTLDAVDAHQRTVVTSLDDLRRRQWRDDLREAAR